MRRHPCRSVCRVVREMLSHSDNALTHRTGMLSQLQKARVSPSPPARHARSPHPLVPALLHTPLFTHSHARNRRAVTLARPNGVSIAEAGAVSIAGVVANRPAVTITGIGPPARGVA